MGNGTTGTSMNPTTEGPLRPKHYCKAESKDGRKCSLYLDHYGKHKPKHGTESDRFGDDE